MRRSSGSAFPSSSTSIGTGARLAKMGTRERAILHEHLRRVLAELGSESVERDLRDRRRGARPVPPVLSCPARGPKARPSTSPVEPARFAAPSTSGLRVTWLGHSTTLLEVDGHRFLTDPAVGRVSPENLYCCVPGSCWGQGPAGVRSMGSAGATSILCSWCKPRVP
jgi:hypothetical protein